MGLLSRILRTSEKKAPRIRFQEAFDGAIRVYEAPTGPAWSCEEDIREGDGFVVLVLKYILPGDPLLTVLYAKRYLLHEDLGAPPDPSSTNWLAEFDTLFTSAPTVTTANTEQMLMRGTLRAVEAVLDGESREHVLPMRIRERRATAGQQQFIVTAIGPKEAFDIHEEVIRSWFGTCAFEIA